MSLWWTLPRVAASALAALVIGFFVVRTQGIYFIMVTMAFAQMVFFLFFDNKALGGSDGLYINSKPAAGLFDLENKRVFYYFTLAMLVLVYAFLRACCSAPRPGAGRHPRERAPHARHGLRHLRLQAGGLHAGRRAGGTGGLPVGHADGLHQPRAHGLPHERARHHDGDPGRHGQLRRRHRGAFAFEYLLHEFKDLPAIGGFNTGKHWQLWMGLFIVAVVVYAPRGLLGLLERAAPQGAAR